MRCNDAILAAFLSHPRYQKREDFIQEGLKLVLDGNWAFARHLPKNSANYGLTQCLPEIIRKQLSTGFWKRKLAEKKSYWILRALKHAQMLPDLVTGNVLRYDPFKRFSESGDLYGFLVRRNITGAMLPKDSLLQHHFVSQIAAMQDKDGSWGGTVVKTSLQLEYLLELGLNADESSVKKGISWIFSQFRETVEGWRSKGPCGVTVRNMFTTKDRRKEFRDALKEMPEEDPKHGCFMSLPLIQTALALRTLVYLGFEDDERVLSSYESLLDIHLPESEVASWCAIGCRRMLEEKGKAERRLKRWG